MRNSFVKDYFWEEATIKEVKYAIAQGADVIGEDDDYQTALHYAAYHATDPEIIKLMVEEGANPNVETSLGLTPLMYACSWNKNPAIAKTLVECGANVWPESAFGQTAWDYAQKNEALKHVSFQDLLTASVPLLESKVIQNDA